MNRSGWLEFSPFALARTGDGLGPMWHNICVVAYIYVRFADDAMKARRTEYKSETKITIGTPC